MEGRYSWALIEAGRLLPPGIRPNMCGENLLDDGIDRYLGAYQYHRPIDFAGRFWFHPPIELQRCVISASAELPRGPPDMNQGSKSHRRSGGGEISPGRIWYAAQTLE
jgi:hypothetical protein